MNTKTRGWMMTGAIADLAEQNAHVLADLAGLVDQLSKPAYTAATDPLYGSSIGQQVRHVIEHGEAAIAAASGEVDYHTRSRDPDTERDPATASHRLNRLMRDLRELGEHGVADNAVRVRHALDTDQGTEETTFPSSIGRELMFLQSHTIHHMAVIGIMAQQHGVQVPHGFGVAPSTRRHWASQEAQNSATAESA